MMMKSVIFASFVASSLAFAPQQMQRGSTAIGSTQMSVEAPPMMAPPMDSQPPAPMNESFADRLDRRLEPNPMVGMRDRRMEHNHPTYGMGDDHRDWRHSPWSAPLLQGGNEDRYGVGPLGLTTTPGSDWKDRSWSRPLLTGGNEERYGAPPMNLTTEPPTDWRHRAWSPPLSQGGNDVLRNPYIREVNTP